MSSKPLFFYNQHRVWQLKVKEERKQMLQKHDEQYYNSYQGSLPN